MQSQEQANTVVALEVAGSSPVIHPNLRGPRDFRGYKAGTAHPGLAILTMALALLWAPASEAQNPGPGDRIADVRIVRLREEQAPRQRTVVVHLGAYVLLEADLDEDGFLNGATWGFDPAPVSFLGAGKFRTRVVLRRGVRYRVEVIAGDGVRSRPYFVELPLPPQRED